MKNIHVYDNASSMSVAAAEWICDHMEKQFSLNERITWLLSGGNTPKQLYDLLAGTPYRERIDWKKIHIFFGDERMVPFEDQHNNGRMAFDHLLSHVPILSGQVHYIRTDIAESDSAKQYEQLLHEYFVDAAVTFDLALMGMGEDGHTLSLFPGSTAVDEKDRWAVSARAPVVPAERITLTAPAVTSSKCIVFMVSGKSKAVSLQQVLNGMSDHHCYPAQIFRDHKNVHWFTDRAAMSIINASQS